MKYEKAKVEVIDFTGRMMVCSEITLYSDWTNFINQNVCPAVNMPYPYDGSVPGGFACCGVSVSQSTYRIHLMDGTTQTMKLEQYGEEDRPYQGFYELWKCSVFY